MMIYLASEGDDDLAVARRLLRHLGLSEAAGPGALAGKSKLDARLHAYAAGAAQSTWLVLRDLDEDAPCAGELVRELLPHRPPQFHLRIAVRAIEAWLLADPTNLAPYLHVPLAKVPRHPDQLTAPKTELVNLARRSTSRQIVADMVPEEGAGRPTGKAYSARVIAFARDAWDPQAAAKRSPSLARCIRALRSIGGRTT